MFFEIDTNPSGGTFWIIMTVLVLVAAHFLLKKKESNSTDLSSILLLLSNAKWPALIALLTKVTQNKEVLDALSVLWENLRGILKAENKVKDNESKPAKP